MAATAVQQREDARLSLQQELDGRLSPADRNRLGRFPTPPDLARDMVGLALPHLRGPVTLLDPALGTGVFFGAALAVFGRRRVRRAAGFEIDAATAAKTAALWGDLGLDVHVGDFCRAAPPARARPNLVVCNPPYVRHHHLPASRKRELRERLSRRKLELSGLAGLYAYFVLLADAWLAPGGVSVWIVPAELLDARYGEAVRGYLAGTVELLRIHRFDPRDVQFADALVTSVVLVFRKADPGRGRCVALTAGGSLATPQRVRRVGRGELDPASRWGPRWDAPTPRDDARGLLGDLFTVRRGLATGANDYFILSPAEARRRRLPKRFLRPVLPGPRLVSGDTIDAGSEGHPLLLDCPLPRETVRVRHPALHAYLAEGERRGLHQRYLPRHRNPWYVQERRPPAPILCTYMGRRRGGRLIRFIRNHSDATATNVYHLLYPRPGLDAGMLDRVFAGLREVRDALQTAGRTYGGGLLKVEPGELAALPLPESITTLADPRRLGP